MPYQADHRIYVNREHTAVVEEDNPDGAVLLVAEGGFLTDEDAAAWGLAGKAGDTADVKPSPEQTAANAQRLSDTERSTASGKSQKGSKNKALSAPEDDKSDDGGAHSGVQFSSAQQGTPEAVAANDAPVPGIQPLPENLTAPGS